MIGEAELCVKKNHYCQARHIHPVFFLLARSSALPLSQEKTFVNSILWTFLLDEFSRHNAERSRPGIKYVPERSADRYKIELTASEQLVDKIRQAQELLRHRLPDGDLATVLERAFDALLPALRKQRFAEVARPRQSPPSETSAIAARGGDKTADSGHTGEAKSCASFHLPDPSPGDVTPEAIPPHEDVEGVISPGAIRQSTTPRSRHIPAEVKRQVARRDDYQCTFTDPTGRRCPERGTLEFHHVRPFGKGGGHEVENIRLLCRGHNALEAASDYGEEVLTLHRKTGQRRTRELAPGRVQAAPCEGGTVSR